MQINKGPNYWPNRFGTPHPVPAKQGGQVLSPQPLPGGVKERVRGPKFSEHYSQATLFWNSMSDVEKGHIVNAFSFELGKCEDKGVIELTLEQINFIDNKLACMVAANLHVPPPKEVHPNHGKTSAFLSMVDRANPNNTFTAEGRKLGLFVHDGFDFGLASGIKAAFTAMGIIVAVVGPRKDKINSSTDGTFLEPQFTFETCRSTLFDAVFFVGGRGPEYDKLKRQGRWLHAAREAFMHFKTVGASGSAVEWLAKYALPGEIDHLVGNLKEDGVAAEQGVVVAGSRLREVPALVKCLSEEIAKHPLAPTHVFSTQTYCTSGALSKGEARLGVLPTLRIKDHNNTAGQSA
ncbi:hypothetical protein FRC01_008967, partial [Tulasnella sp. 417]